MRIGPMMVIKLFAFGAVAAGLANMYLVLAMKSFAGRFASRFVAEEFASTNLLWTWRIRRVLGADTIEYMRTRTILFPALELAVGAALVTAAAVNGVSALLVRDVVYLLFAFSLAVINWQGGDMLLPNALTLPAIPVGLAVAVATSATPLRALTDGLIGIAVGYLIPRLISDVYWRVTHREGLGLGVANMLAGIGAFYGWKAAIAAMFFSSMIGSTVGLTVFLTRARGQRLMETELAFGHFLAVGGFLAGVFSSWLQFRSPL